MASSPGQKSGGSVRSSSAQTAPTESRSLPKSSPATSIGSAPASSQMRNMFAQAFGVRRGGGTSSAIAIKSRTVRRRGHAPSRS